MYKLIIAEDEEKLKRGLCNFIPWPELGFEVIAAFSDGKEVLDYLSQHSVDVVFTDIQMTDVSGLEIAKFVHEHQRACKVVVISGYKEFSYARQAIEYKVEHFLIKPVDTDEIGRVFTELKRRLDREQQLEHTFQKERDLVEEILPFLQEQLFVDLAIGAILSDQELERRLRLAGLQLAPACSAALTTIYVSDYEKAAAASTLGKDQLKNALAHILREQSGPIMQYIIFNQQQHFTLLSIALESQALEEFRHQLKQQLEEAREIFADFFGLAFSISHEGYCHHLFEISPLFQQAVGTGSGQQPWGFAYLIEKLKLVLSKLNDGNGEPVQPIWSSYMREISQLPFDKQHSLFLQLLPSLSDYAGLNTTGTGDDSQPKTGQQLLSRIFQGVAADPEKSSNIMIEKAKQYIEMNYHQDLSLDDVASRVFLNPIYFSRFFKRETGEKFIDYITRLRMKKAIALLIENKYKVYEISAMVGYRSDKYFAKLFKQYTGYSPRDYLKHIMKGSEGRGDA